MHIIQWAISPWGQEVPIHIAWVLIWVFAIAGLAFLVVHAIWARYFAKPEEFADAPLSGAAEAAVPAEVKRHSLAARLFHWVMAASMLVLLFTAFLPRVGVRFSWVTYHWIAGLVLIASIIFHIIHASFFMDFWSIWPDKIDIADAKNRTLQMLGKSAPLPRRFAKYPFENKMYHLTIVLTGLSVAITGGFMIFRVRTPFLTRNPYLFSDMTWGMMYVLHGLAGVALIALITVHIYFALRPEKLSITRSMVLGTITREHFVEYHDPTRWDISSQGIFSASQGKRSRLIESTGKPHMPLQDLAERCNVVEECYEFMLAYAAQGLSRDSGTGSGDQLRLLLGKAVVALTGFSETYKAAIVQSGLQPVARHEEFLAVLDRDCKAALAAMELVAAQPVISSMLIDNLNASVHLRTLLTDLFLLDEIAKLHQAAGDQAVSAEL